MNAVDLIKRLVDSPSTQVFVAVYSCKKQKYHGKIQYPVTRTISPVTSISYSTTRKAFIIESEEGS